MANEGENRRAILDGVVTSVAKHMQTDACSIYIYDEEDKELRLHATQGLGPDAVGTVKLKLGEGIIGRAVRELRPICVGRVSGNTDYKHFAGIEEEQYEAFLTVPILRGLRRTGALAVQARESHHPRRGSCCQEGHQGKYHPRAFGQFRYSARECIDAGAETTR